MSSDRRLLELSGKAHYRHLLCPSHPKDIAGCYSDEDPFAWAIKLRCIVKKCYCHWWVCKECKLYKPLKDIKSVRRHHRMKHRDRVENRNTKISTPAVQPSQVIVSPQRCSIPSTHFSREASIQYFQAVQENEGNMYLISNAVFKRNVKNLHTDDVKMMTSIGHFLSTLTRNQREDFAQVLQATTQATFRQAKETFASNTLPNNTVSIPVPTTKEQLRKFFVEGKSSVFQCLPHPKVFELSDHAFVLPSECIADIMAHGFLDCTPPPKIDQVETMAKSTVAKKIICTNEKRGLKSIFLSIWSDGFEPNYSKTNRGSVWILTLAIITEYSGNPDIAHVYPIAIGPSSNSHVDVCRKIFDDINSLCFDQNGGVPIKMYNGKTRSMDQVSVHLICVTQDQPERREFAGLLLGGKKFHSRYGWSFFVAKVVKKMIPCPACLQHMMNTNNENIWIPLKCNVCYNFWQDPTQMKVKFEDVNFPKEKLDKGGYLLCKKLSYHDLIEAATTAHENIVNGVWSPDNAASYLTTLCMNNDTVSEIVECAKNVSKKRCAEQTNDQETLNACITLQSVDPVKFTKWNPLPIWSSGLSLQQSTEPCMHQLFLGVEKNMAFLIQDWAALRNKYSSLQRELCILTNQIESLHLSWCKVQPYKGDKLGGWVSENFRAFSRLSPWVYSSLYWISEDPPFQKPDKPVSKWTIAQCKGFLRQRRIPLDGKVSQLRKKVQENIHSPVLPPLGGRVETVQMMILMKWQMISHLMGMTNVSKNDPNIASRLIRLFLWSLATLEEAGATYTTNTSSSLPIWVSQYNNQCLLNIPDQIELLGPVRNRYEGGIAGEGGLRKVKPIIRAGRQNWQLNAMSRMYRERTMKLMQMNDIVGEDISVTSSSISDENTQVHETDSFHCYQNYSHLLEQFTNHHPLSVIITVDPTIGNVIYACFKVNGKKRLVKVINEQGKSKYHFGLWYHSFTLTSESFSNDADIVHPLVESEKIQAYGLLLPLLGEFPNNDEETNRNKFALITSNWKVMCEDSTFHHPHYYLHVEFEK